MKIRRAIGFAVLGYVITMIIGLGIAYISGIDMSQMASNPPAWCWIVSAVAAIVVMGCMAYAYFRSSKVAKGLNQGIYFGVLAIVVGFILDMATLVPGYGWEPLKQYYSMPIFRVTLVIVIVTSAIVGKRAAK